MYSFLKNKLKKWNFSDLLLCQVEAVIQWFVMYLPSFPGMVARTLIYKVLLKKLDGFLFAQANVQFVHMNRIKIGKNVSINSGTYLNGFGELDIGNFVLIGSNVTISSGQHPIEGIEPTIIERPSIPKKISLQDGVWIGAGAVIMPGVTLGKGTVVGANSVVTKNTDDFSVVVGVPAKMIRKR